MASISNWLVIARFIGIFIVTGFLNHGCATTKPSPSEQLVSQGNEFAKEGLLREASNAYKKALKVNANNKAARRNLGIIELKLKNYPAGVANLEKVISSYEDDFDSNFWLAEGLRATERYADAIYRYKKALGEKDSHLRTMKALAWSYYKIRYYSEALNIAKDAQKIAPKDVQNNVILARILIKVDQPQQALAVLSKARVGMKADNLPYLQSVEGDAHLAMSHCTEAIKTYRDALKAQPLLPGPLLGLGRCHLSQGKQADAITYMERAVRIKPNYTEAVLALAEAYEGSDQAKSIKYYKAFRRLAVKDPEYVDKLALAKSKVGKMTALRSEKNSATKPSNKN